MSELVVYDAPSGAIGIDDYKVSVRIPGKDWQDLFVYEVQVDMHNVRKASMVYFDMNAPVEVRIDTQTKPIEKAIIRPLSLQLPFIQDHHTVTFMLDKPSKIVVEINGERFSALHLFANPIELAPINLEDGKTVLLQPGIHGNKNLQHALETPLTSDGELPNVLYFAPGIHYIEEMIYHIPSGTTVYLAGGAVLIGSLVCEDVSDVTIRGRGIIYLKDFHRFTAFRGLRIVFSKRITVEGVIVIDPPHYSVYMGNSENVQIRNFKSFSTRGWSDGIDMMACSNVEIEDIFMRNSDDCIAIYGSRGDYYGDSRNVTVQNAVLWADVAHPLNIGIHGDHKNNGDVIENIYFKNIDILEHHEPQENYWGAMSINAGDMNTVRNVTYEDIRVEDFELGQLVDLRVVWNEKYNPAPGRRIENIVFRNISYNGTNRNQNRIYGFDEARMVENVRFENLSINGELILTPEQGNFDVNPFASGISFHQLED